MIVLSMHSDELYVRRALAAGAKAYLLKESAEEVLIEAVNKVMTGTPYFSSEIPKLLVQSYQRRYPADV